MDVKNVNVFTEVLVSSFETAVNSVPYRYAEFKRLEGDIKSSDDMMCTVTFTGALKGAFILTFPEKTAKHIYKALIFEEAEKLGPEVFEAFTEILNMVVGNVKASLSGRTIDFTTPKVEAGKNAKFPNPEKLIWLFIPMEFREWGKFSLYIGVKD